jgi:phosphoribosylformylglycinamidine synthase
MAYEIPLLSGKDSMYVDGNLQGHYGETHKVSALETLQFSTISLIDDISRCVTMDSKVAGDLVYILGKTRNELGASEYYQHLGYIGRNIPEVRPEEFIPTYRNLMHAINNGLVASAHGIYRGGLAVHLAMVAMGGNLGLQTDLTKAPGSNGMRDDVVLFSESAGRFIVTVDPDKRKSFEDIFKTDTCACIGKVTAEADLAVSGQGHQTIVAVSIADLKAAWKKPFGDLI